MVSITSKPLRELALGPADFSPVKLDVSSNSTDASHPWKIIKKHIRYEHNENYIFLQIHLIILVVIFTLPMKIGTIERLPSFVLLVMLNDLELVSTFVANLETDACYHQSQLM